MVWAWLKYVHQRYMCQELGPQCGSVELVALRIESTRRWLGLWGYCPQTDYGGSHESSVPKRISCYKDKPDC